MLFVEQKIISQTVIVQLVTKEIHSSYASRKSVVESTTTAPEIWFVWTATHVVVRKTFSVKMTTVSLNLKTAPQQTHVH